MGTAAMAAVGTGLNLGAAEAPASNLRVGILSDIHVTALSNAQWLEKALRKFDEAKVDAVLVSGDLFTCGSTKELEDIASVWFKVFPGDRRSDGAPVVRLFVTGNHDETDWHCFKKADDLLARGFNPNRETVWKRLFGEEYRQVFMKEVKGYKFVLRHWVCHRRVLDGLEFPADRYEVPDFIREHAEELHACARPFFYVQHEPIDDTVNATWLVGGAKWDNGQINRGEKRLLAQFPNCVALTGHSHDSLTDEQSIWQGEFTAVNCGCARGYAFSRPGRENGFNCDDFGRKPPMEMARYDHGEVRQGMVMDVSADEIRFQRFDLTYDRPLGEDWTVPLYAGGATVPPAGTPKYDFAARKAASKPPAFAADAKVQATYVKDGHRRTADGMGALDMKESHPQLRVTFPPIVRPQSPSRGFDFRVTCETLAGDIANVVQERRVFSPKFSLAESMDTAPCVCNFPLAELPRNRKIRFSVIPYNDWGVAGRAIFSDWLVPDKLAKG